MKFKTKTAAICFAFLNGEVLTIMDGFKRFLVSNLPREASRQIEQKFGVKLARVTKQFKTEFGVSGCYNEYSLNKTKYNNDGIKKMWEYVDKNMVSPAPKNKKNGYQQQSIF